MSKRINSFKSNLLQYLKTPNIGALFVDVELNENDQSPGEGRSYSNGTSTSRYLASKDCYFLVGPDEMKSLQISSSSCKTFNGISSLVYFDEPITASLTDHRCKDTFIEVMTTKKNIQQFLQSPHFLLSKLSYIDDELVKKIQASEPVESILFYLKTLYAISSDIDKRRIILIDSHCDCLPSELAAYVYMLNTSNIIIGSKYLSSTIFDHFQPISEFFLDDGCAQPSPIGSPVLAQTNNYLYSGHVTAIINLYKRYDSVLDIYKSLIKQTYPVASIYVWVNGISDPEALDSLRLLMPRARFVISDENVGVWARFAYGLNVTTEYTVIFDDDTVPGIRWIENCINTFKSRPALLGTVGLIYNSRDRYMDHIRVGWPSANSEPVEVDIVGHSWFFKTSWLSYYWASRDDLSGLEFCGEDMHFSYALQEQCIPTVVPPHPSHDRDLWGSLQAIEKGTGSEAISVSGKGSHMDLPLRRLIQRGFLLQKFMDSRLGGSVS